MKKTFNILSMALFALAIAAPAEAGRWTPVRADNVRDNINALEADINQADRRDTISEREAADLRARVASLRAEFNTKNANGLKKSEVKDLNNRVERIRERLRSERADADHHAG
jgi:septal ring factor EnvC (AmiA/AmiB activator)